VGWGGNPLNVTWIRLANRVVLPAQSVLDARPFETPCTRYIKRTSRFIYIQAFAQVPADIARIKRTRYNDRTDRTNLRSPPRRGHVRTSGIVWRVYISDSNTAFFLTRVIGIVITPGVVITSQNCITSRKYIGARLYI